MMAQSSAYIRIALVLIVTLLIGLAGWFLLRNVFFPSLPNNTLQTTIIRSGTHFNNTVSITSATQYEKMWYLVKAVVNGRDAVYIVIDQSATGKGLYAFDPWDASRIPTDIPPIPQKLKDDLAKLDNEERGE